MDAFFLGLKLSDWYEYSDKCIDDIAFMLDDINYFQNNITLFPTAPNETWFNPFLNVTGLIGGNLSAIIPDCYRFGKSVYVKETARWLSFGSNWGNFFLAFLFNQMGNALNFQQRIVNIQLYEETQNFQGYYTEIGAIVHLIWDFQPLTSSVLNAITSDEVEGLIDKFTASFFDDNSSQKVLFKDGLTKVIGYLRDYASLVDKQVALAEE
jgi:hypothetical protein